MIELNPSLATALKLGYVCHPTDHYMFVNYTRHECWAKGIRGSLHRKRIVFSILSLWNIKFVANRPKRNHRGAAICTLGGFVSGMTPQIFRSALCERSESPLRWINLCDMHSNRGMSGSWQNQMLLNITVFEMISAPFRAFTHKKTQTLISRKPRFFGCKEPRVN